MYIIIFEIILNPIVF